MKNYYEWIIYILFLVGAILHPIPMFRNFMIKLTPFTLILTTAIVLINIMNEKKIILWFLIVFIITMIIEIMGVKTKMIFGNYNYGSTLGIKIFEVPIIIGFNWVLVILGAIQIISKITTNKLFLILFSSILTVLFDLILEPIAIKLNYWNWYKNIIPLQNYLAWFIVSSICVITFIKLNINLRNDLPAKYFITQFLFFLILSIFI